MIWQAVHAGFAYFQREAGYTRTGSHNTRVNGRETGQWHEADLAVAHWLQHTSRDGDMQLHVHSQIAHIAKTSTDGKWRAPDSLGYNEHIGAVAAIVSQHLEEALTRRFGLQWIARDDGHGFEIKGISGEMMRVFSSRRESINADLRVRAARFEQRYGRKPSNGCGADGCSGGALNVRTGPVTAADITTTPGAYQCFYVTALNKAGASTSTNPGCTSTPGINIPSTQEWTDTGVTVPAGAAVGISATGDAYLSGAGSSQGPGGDPSCTPAADYAAHNTQFPAPQLPCWSLIARIGNGRPFEVGTSILIPTTAGKLYLGVNADSFSANTGIWAVKIKIGGLP